MNKNLSKYATIAVANLIVIAFPVCFAFNVFNSFNLEGVMINKPSISTNINEVNAFSNIEENNSKCSSPLIINIIFAIFLAALWNAKKIIKIGTI